jgi:serine/threonine-protein phosphatase PGAM5
MSTPRSCRSLWARRCAVFIGLLGILCGPADGDAGAERNTYAHTIYLVRHGAYEPDEKADPVAGPGISPLGIAQSRLVASRLIGLPIRFTSITSSTMTRARETAAVIQQTLKISPSSRSPLLSECIPPAFRSFDGESAEEQAACAKRLDAAFAENFRPAIGTEKADLIVAHGNVIRFFVTKALGVDTRAWFRMSVAHASITTIRVQPDGSMTVLAVGDVGHIPLNLQSGTTDNDPALRVPARVP